MYKKKSKNNMHARAHTHQKKQKNENKILQVALVTESNAASVSISAPTEELVFSQTSPVLRVLEAFATSDDVVVF